MDKIKITNYIKTGVSFLLGSVTQHYSSKLLNRNEVMLCTQQEALQTNRHEELTQGLKTLKNGNDNCIDYINSVIKQMYKINDNLKNNITCNPTDLQTAVEEAAKLEEESKEITKLLQEGIQNGTGFNDSSLIANIICNNMESRLKKLNKILFQDDSIDTNTFLPNINTLQEYLDTLSLLELSALFNILILLLVLITIIGITTTLFANEIIKIFHLDSKYPRLEPFFKLRVKFQAYYFAWNLALLVFVCVGGISINLLALV